MIKAELREMYKAKRLIISPLEKRKLTDLIVINFQKVTLPFLRYVHTYLGVASKNEIDTHQITGYLKFINPGLKVCVPKINPATGHMEHFIYTENMKMVKNKFGIEEPANGIRVDAADIDLVLTPLLAFDQKGHRVGFGKGYYDKFFSNCRSDVIKAGLSFFEAADIIHDTNTLDVPLNYCITPKNVYRF